MLFFSIPFNSVSFRCKYAFFSGITTTQLHSQHVLQSFSSITQKSAASAAAAAHFSVLCECVCVCIKPQKNLLALFWSFRMTSQLCSEGDEMERRNDSDMYRDRENSNNWLYALKNTQKDATVLTANRFQFLRLFLPLVFGFWTMKILLYKQPIKNVVWYKFCE